MGGCERFSDHSSKVPDLYAVASHRTEQFKKQDYIWKQGGGGIEVRNFPQFSAISQFFAIFRNFSQFSAIFRNFPQFFRNFSHFPIF